MVPAQPFNLLFESSQEDEEDIRRAVKAGARGYLIKVADCEQIEEAVRAVAAGTRNRKHEFSYQLSLKLIRIISS